jgi:hypothetical protein
VNAPVGAIATMAPPVAGSRVPLPSRSLDPARLRNRRPGLPRNPSPNLAPPLSLPHGRLRSHNLGPCPNPRLVRWLHLPNRSLSPAPFLRTRSIRRLPPANPVWAVLREVPRGIALVQATWVA